MQADESSFQFDTHSHSHWSDGDLSVPDLVARAAHHGIRGLVLTDHGTTLGWPRFRDECRRAGMETLPGAETAALGVGGWFDVALYGAGLESREIQNVLCGHRRALVEICTRYLGWIGKQDSVLSWTEIERYFGLPSGSTPSLYFVNKYRRESSAGARSRFGTDIRAAGLLARERDEFYLPALLPLRELVQAMDRVGGVVGLLHPTKSAGMLARRSGDPHSTCLLRLLELAMETGVHAIEVSHPTTSPNDLETIEHFAAGRLRIGGSDFHGDRAGQHKPQFTFGGAGISEDEFRELARRSGWRRMN